MKNGKIRIISGLFLIVLQIISCFSLYISEIKLWNDADDTYSYSYMSPDRSDFNFTKWSFAFEVGNEKFVNSFKYMLDEDKEYGIDLTLNEKVSILVRESLGCDKYEKTNPMLYIFDINILIGYLFYGILGVGLFISGYRDTDFPKEIEGNLDLVDVKPYKLYRIICMLLLFLSMIFQILFVRRFLEIIIMVFLLMFFVKYIGRRKTVLLSSAVILFAIVSIWYSLETVYDWFFMDTEELNFWTFPTLIFSLLALASGIIRLIIGIKLYYGKGNNKFKRLNIVSFFLEINRELIWPIILFIVYDSLFIWWVNIPNLIFSVVMSIYFIKIPFDDSVKYDQNVLECQVNEKTDICETEG